MSTTIRRLAPALLFAAAVTTTGRALAHCQVPCGIYGDPARFDMMLEDTQTIAKAIGQVEQLAGAHGANDLNQLVRWVTTKEQHATNIQRTIADYFMAQRIKGDNPKYVEQLTKAHQVMVAAMKAKQAADPATAEALEKAIVAFRVAYLGEEAHDADHDAAGHHDAGHDH